MSPPLEEEGAAETCDELTVSPIPCPPVPLGVGRRERNRIEVETGRREGWGEGVLRSSFIFHCPTLI